MQIVIAWTTQEVEVVRQRRTDLGEHPDTRMVTAAHAAMWLNHGKPADLEKAQRFAATEPGHVVLTYEGERNPLQRAKSDVLKRKKV